jgi:hypothetical protein
LRAVHVDRNATPGAVPVCVGVALAGSQLDGDAVQQLLPLAARREADGADGLWLSVAEEGHSPCGC